MKIIRKTIMVSALGLAPAINVNAQTNLQFTAATSTDEQAIRLTWASQSNHVYQIQYANALATNANGSTAWQILYDDYPSQGTNTFWLDTGNYFNVPPILHPKKMPMRFYRIVDKGPDDLIGDEPTVFIISPTNDSVASDLLTVTVTAGTDQGNVYPKLYVDGQAMWPSQDGSNYVINTCEWGNGQHVLFATADSLTQPDGPAGSVGLAGHAVSPFVWVTFSNLITRISFSEEFFQPSLGQTQQVSAVFVANCDWTLTIRDAFSNAVRTATGSGTSMSFNWDGTGDGGATIPNGVYYYYISAQTNGESSDIVIGGSGGGSGGSVPSPSFARSSGVSSDSSSSMELWAVSADLSDGPVPLALYPPGIDTNGLTIFAATPSEIQSLRPPVPHANSLVTMGGGSFAPADASAPAAQASPPAPLRPPTPPCKGTVGEIAVVYQMYNANGTNPVYASPIPDGSEIPGHDVEIQSNPGTRSLPYAPFKNVDLVAINFADEMGKACWDLDYSKHDDQLHLSDLQGSGTFFNNADIGLLIIHGAYGTSSDYTTGRPLKGIYFPIASGGGAQYLRMTDMSLGGSSPTNGLKWMAILACFSLYQQNWTSMNNQNAHPYNSNLHMILGTGTEFDADPLIGQYWADYMLGDPSVHRDPMKIRDAWYQAAIQAYTVGVANGAPNYPNPTTFAVVADPSCTEDSLQTNSVPTGGTWIYNSKTVYPIPQ